MCAKDAPGGGIADACQGDSGGPLECRPKTQEERDDSISSYRRRF